MAKKDYKETALFPPVRDWLTARGYKVRAEVRSCDIVALRGDELIIAELKKTFSLDLLLQAVKRQRIADSVYLAIPHNAIRYDARTRDILRVVRRMEMGLLAINMNLAPPAVKELVTPRPYRNNRNDRYARHERQAVLMEFVGRGVELNTGGSSQERIYTAYKLRALRIAEYLQAQGACKASDVAKALNIPTARQIMYSNPLGWFKREQGRTGVYHITPAAARELAEYRARLAPTAGRDDWPTDDGDY